MLTMTGCAYFSQEKVAGTVIFRNQRWKLRQPQQVANFSRRSTFVPVSAKLGTESRFWAFVGVQSAKIALGE